MRSRLTASPGRNPARGSAKRVRWRHPHQYRREDVSGASSSSIQRRAPSRLDRARRDRGWRVRRLVTPIFWRRQCARSSGRKSREKLPSMKISGYMLPFLERLKAPCRQRTHHQAPVTGQQPGDAAEAYDLDALAAKRFLRSNIRVDAPIFFSSTTTTFLDEESNTRPIE